MTKIFSFILVSLLITVSASAQATHWRGPTGNGIYPDKNLLKEWPAEGPAMLWHFDELGEGHSSAAVTNNLIYINGELNGIGYLFA